MSKIDLDIAFGGLEPLEPIKEKVKENKIVALLSVYIDEDGRVEESYVLENFGREESFRRFIESDICEYLSCELNTPDEVMAHDLKFNSLYHIYVSYWSDSYMTDCGTEYDAGIEFEKVELVMENYGEYVQIQNEIDEKNEQKAKHTPYQIDFSSYDHYCSRGMNYHDLYKAIEALKWVDIALAHRLATQHKDLKNALGDMYDKELYKTEMARIFLRGQIYSHDELETRYVEHGYKLKAKNYWYKRPKQAELDITYDMIDSLKKEDMIGSSVEEIVARLLNTSVDMLFSDKRTAIQDENDAKLKDMFDDGNFFSI